jgi:hypothetical protein
VIANVVTRIVNRNDERNRPEQWQGQVEPHVALLKMHDIGLKLADLPQNAADRLYLAKWLAKSRLIDWLKVDRGIDCRLMFRCFTARQHQQYVAFAREAIRLLNAVLYESVRNDGDAHAISG